MVSLIKILVFYYFSMIFLIKQTSSQVKSILADVIISPNYVDSLGEYKFSIYPNDDIYLTYSIVYTFSNLITINQGNRQCEVVKIISKYIVW